MKSLIKEIEDKFEEIEESNVTGNLDGGEGPPKLHVTLQRVKMKMIWMMTHSKCWVIRNRKKKNEHKEIRIIRT